MALFNHVLSKIDTEERFHFEEILERNVRELIPQVNIASENYTLPQICAHLSPYLEENPTVFFITLSQNILHALDKYGQFKMTEVAPSQLYALNPNTRIATKQVFHQHFEKILYIKINGFFNGIVPEYLKSLFENQENLHEKEKIIIDLRNNEGGEIADVQKVVDFFLPENLRIMTYRLRDSKTEGKLDTVQPQLIHLPVDVLVNHNTASSAEIVAGALQHYARARIIGENMYGKTEILTEKDLIGDLQIQFNAKIRYTRGKFWIAENISAPDLRPDIYLKNPNAPIEELLPILQQ